MTANNAEKKYRNLDLLSKCIKQDMADYLRGDLSFFTLLKYVWIDLLELRSSKKYDAMIKAQLDSLKEK